MNLPDDFVFSQSSLQDYTDCPRRFYLRYLQKVRWPAVEAEPALEHEQRLQQGERFHHLLHQHTLGVPADDLTLHIDDPEIGRWWQTYLELALNDVAEARRPEITLSAPLGKYRVLAKFDLLTREPGGKLLIVDWKTSPTAPKREWLQKRLQTTVYRTVLALAGAELNDGKPVAPEQIQMTYWYVSGQQVHFPYDTAQFKADGTFLRGLVSDIERRAEQDDFPLTPETRFCRFCTYRSLCDRGEKAGSVDDLLDEAAESIPPDDFAVDLDQVAEIEF